MRKLLTALLIGMFLITNAAISNAATQPAQFFQVALKLPSAPKISSGSKSVGGGGKNYSPSKSNASSSSTAPSGSPSSFMSSFGGIGGFAKGVLTGALLGAAISSVFGDGAGFIGRILGILFNVIMFMVLSRFVMWAWHKFRASIQSN